MTIKQMTKAFKNMSKNVNNNYLMPYNSKLFYSNNYLDKKKQQKNKNLIEI